MLALLYAFHISQEREQVISYKRKPTTKPNKESDDDIESANSLKSHVFSEDSVHSHSNVGSFQQKEHSFTGTRPR